jgi:predicted SnoaL-like aldol condensation-catalyzing enzyme
VFERGDTTAIDRHVRPDYIQHNPLAPDGPEAMKAFGAGMRQQFPDAKYDVLRVLSEGDLVLLHSSGVLVPGTPGMAVFDIFRFQDGKIAEHWDILQEVPQARPGGPRSLPGQGRKDRRALGRRAGRAGDLRQRQHDVLIARRVRSGGATTPVR